MPITAASIPRVCALCLCGALRIVWRCRQTEYGGSPSTCFIALCGGKHGCSSRRGRTSRFFRTPTSTRTGRFPVIRLEHPILCKQLHQFSAKLSARWPLTLPLSRHGSTQRASLTPHSVAMPSLDERCYWLTSHWPHSAWRPSWQTHLSPWLSFS